MIGRAWLSILLSAALFASQTGCVAASSQTRTLHTPQPGPGLSAIAALGPTGVSAGWGAPEPDISISEPSSGRLAGAGRGAARGALTGLGAAYIGWEGVKGGCTGDCRVQAAWLLTWTALGLALMPVGAVVGAVVGAAKTPPEQVRRAQTALVDAVAAAELPRTIRDETIRLGSERTGHTLVPITSQGREAADHEVGTVLEILIRHVGLERRASQSTIPGDAWLDTDPEFELRLDVDARLVRASDGAVLYSDLFQEIVPSRQFSVWVADDGRALRDDLRWIAGLLADQIAMVVLLGSQIQQREGHPLPSGSFAYARAAYERGNYATALWLFGRLAEQGDADAQYNLGLMYNTGQGGAQDYVQAYMWFTLAAARFPASQAERRGKAIRDRDEVAAKMTPEQIDEAQRLAQEWKPE